MILKEFEAWDIDLDERRIYWKMLNSGCWIEAVTNRDWKQVVENWIKTIPGFFFFPFFSVFYLYILHRLTLQRSILEWSCLFRQALCYIVGIGAAAVLKSGFNSWIVLICYVPTNKIRLFASNEKVHPSSVRLKNSIVYKYITGCLPLSTAHFNLFSQQVSFEKSLNSIQYWYNH